jgi:hypothetical protein
VALIWGSDSIGWIWKPNQYGLAFYKGKWRYFEKHTPVKEGMGKGWHWIYFRNGGKRLVRPQQIKRMLCPPDQASLFE